MVASACEHAFISRAIESFKPNYTEQMTRTIVLMEENDLIIRKINGCI